MRDRLRTLMIVLAIGPIALAGVWFAPAAISWAFFYFFVDHVAP